MRAQLLLTLRSLRAKYWFIPAMMALGAMALAVGMVALDRYFGMAWIERATWLNTNEAEGARALLSTIAGSMITVAGVTFSITIAALATTASTFGPRLISNFMQDRGNQITLGTFIATFLYCILVLRTVRAGQDEVAFVPHLSVLVALLFALASLGVLIYFIHHVPESIHISNILARLGYALVSQVERVFPETHGDEPETATRPPIGWPGRTPFEVRAGSNGYVEYVDTAGLMSFAAKRDLMIEFFHRPGEFVSARTVLAQVGGAGRDADAVAGRVRAAVVIGDYRSEEQDVHYLMNRLVEVAARALSPGMNDIFTATNAMDWLASGLLSLARRRTPDDILVDATGHPRIRARARTFDEAVALVFDQLRPYAADDRNAALHLMRILAAIGREASSEDRRKVVALHAEALNLAAGAALDHPRDRALVETAYDDVQRALGTPPADGSAERH